uniref:Uncharacterized protein n=1 Tax=Glossina pallidipes TaxID=7398 RepID=A0A1A9ZZT9_GLOPL
MDHDYSHNKKSSLETQYSIKNHAIVFNQVLKMQPQTIRHYTNKRAALSSTHPSRTASNCHKIAERVSENLNFKGMDIFPLFGSPTFFITYAGILNNFGLVLYYHASTEQETIAITKEKRGREKEIYAGYEKSHRKKPIEIFQAIIFFQ